MMAALNFSPVLNHKSFVFSSLRREREEKCIESNNGTLVVSNDRVLTISEFDISMLMLKIKNEIKRI